MSNYSFPNRILNTHRARHSFSKFQSVIDVPNLLDIQQESFEEFLQLDIPPAEREEVGIEEVFRHMFPITNYNGTASLEYVSYEIGTWESSCGYLKGQEKRYDYSCQCGHIKGNGVKDGPFDEDGFNKICEVCNSPAVYIKSPVSDTRVALKMKYDVEECKQLSQSYTAPLKVMIRLIVWDKDEQTGVKTIRDIKEQQVYLGELPIMTDVYEDEENRIRCGNKGIFIINGTERVIVSQMHRSPGVYFGIEKSKTTAGNKTLFTAKVIPYRGSWLEFEFDNNDVLHVRIDRKRKLPATVLLRALGINTTEEILNLFYDLDTVTIENNFFKREVSNRIKKEKFKEDVRDDDGNIMFHRGKPVSMIHINKLTGKGVTHFTFGILDLIGKVVGRDIIDPETGEILATTATVIDEPLANQLIEAGIEQFSILLDSSNVGHSLVETLRKDKGGNFKEAQRDIYKVLRPGDPLTEESAAALFNKLFFDPRTFDLSKVGRLKLNRKLRQDPSVTTRCLRKEDILEAVRYLLKLKSNEAGYEVDDIDHLGNRRVRNIGELLQNQLRIGLARIEKAIKERMNMQDLSTVMPYDLINSKPVTATIKEFFGSSQLSQFMDQTNPIAELTHKRRLSALGPGGLSRDRAGFEVRDVHPTHYGRICPIETPEGPNVGLITSLSTYARVDLLGFIETPYQVVEESKVSPKIEFLNALDEDSTKERTVVIAQANAPLLEDRTFATDQISSRKMGETALVAPDEINYMDISPKQLVSVSASLIPFLEHDDANRALMGSNMMRQAVPCVRAQAPLVGTGMEAIAAYDSGVMIIARKPGMVESVTSERIIIRSEPDPDAPTTDIGVEIYDLRKFQRSNQSTCVNQKAIVDVGDYVEAGQVIADGPATELGELALGQNVLTAFMPWQGYNFEDAILVSERISKEDFYTSIHVEEFDTEARETKLGKEEITRDIPNAGEERLKNIDESGVIRLGAWVKAGDVLVGKVTPKGETQLTPEEKLLRAIFGEKAGDVRDASLKVPPGTEGVVVDVRVFARRGTEKDNRMQEIEEREVERIRRRFEIQRRVVLDNGKESIIALVTGFKLTKDLKGKTHEGMVTLRRGTDLAPETLGDFDFDTLQGIEFDGGLEMKQELQSVIKRVQAQLSLIESSYNNKVEKLNTGDELSPGVLKMVKVFVAIKRKLQVGDKMAGRHGNKGVVSRIQPEHEMPFLADGTPVDICLNPLGVPSRMNVGQILEIHLGWAAGTLNRNVATPVFDGATEGEIKGLLNEAGLPESAQTTLYDGRTGEAYLHPVTVGYMYMLKLHHLVDDKIHARSIGPYSLVTQQPLGGKAQFGGQRFGEMEVWALEAYGAAYVLQELLTVKSDDVSGRTKIYQAIVKGTTNFNAGLPESFKVLMTELKSLALDIEPVNVRADAASQNGAPKAANE